MNEIFFKPEWHKERPKHDHDPIDEFGPRTDDERQELRDLLRALKERGDRST